MKHLLKQWKKIEKDIKNKHIYLFLDFDGTLVPIRRHPDSVRLSVSMKSVLEKLAARKDISIAVISGRKLCDVERRVKIENIIYTGNHGLEIKGEKNKKAIKRILEAKNSINKIAEILKKELQSLKGIFVENKGITLSVHYRMADKDVEEKAFSIFQETIERCKKHDKEKIRVTRGKKVWEVRPLIDWDKGKIVRFLLDKKKKFLKAPIKFFYIGDDRTDEDAFSYVRKRGYAVKVARQKGIKTLADYYLRGTAEVRELLSRLYCSLKEGD
ncbi:MAG: trehalose-phosphatase [Candidatus Omnitrophota bacterium]